MWFHLQLFSLHYWSPLVLYWSTLRLSLWSLSVYWASLTHSPSLFSITQKSRWLNSESVDVMFSFWQVCNRPKRDVFVALRWSMSLMWLEVMMLWAKKTRQKRPAAVKMQELCVAEPYVTSKHSLEVFRSPYQVHRNTLTTLRMFLNY